MPKKTKGRKSRGSAAGGLSARSPSANEVSQQQRARARQQGPPGSRREQGPARARPPRGGFHQQESWTGLPESRGTGTERWRGDRIRNEGEVSPGLRAHRRRRAHYEGGPTSRGKSTQVARGKAAARSGERLPQMHERAGEPGRPPTPEPVPIPRVPSIPSLPNYPPVRFSPPRRPPAGFKLGGRVRKLKKEEGKQIAKALSDKQKATVVKPYQYKQGGLVEQKLTKGVGAARPQGFYGYKG